MIDWVIIAVVLVACPIAAGLFVRRNRDAYDQDAARLNAALEGLGHALADAYGITRLRRWLRDRGGRA